MNATIMKQLLAIFVLAPLLALHAAADKPNILYILADDLGYNDVGFNGGKEIKNDEVMKDAAVCLTGVAPGTKITNRNKDKDEDIQ